MCVKSNEGLRQSHISRTRCQLRRTRSRDVIRFPLEGHTVTLSDSCEYGPIYFHASVRDIKFEEHASVGKYKSLHKHNSPFLVHGLFAVTGVPHNAYKYDRISRKIDRTIKIFLYAFIVTYFYLSRYYISCVQFDVVSFVGLLYIYKKKLVNKYMNSNDDNVLRLFFSLVVLRAE